MCHREDMPKTRITGPENSGNLRSLQVLQLVHTCISTTGYSEPVPLPSEDL